MITSLSGNTAAPLPDTARAHRAARRGAPLSPAPAARQEEEGCTALDVKARQSPQRPPYPVRDKKQHRRRWGAVGLLQRLAAGWGGPSASSVVSCL
ncbi:hypothetical protein NDU88_008091 [Pleurodeles waltl]|uniref:Uncharacterized protein n=1 Tax=Pleurodeles waltl TaxID=8319 RepID=A0AAV7SUW7_PLEWA|nr:hypothetical protein NDU88_008091 [Pleurodeles waltl]